MAKRQYIKDSFYGGMSEDDRLGGPNRFLYSENINIHSNSNYIELYKKPERQNTTTEQVYSMLPIVDRVTNTGKILCFSEDAIYHSDSDTAIYTNSSLNKLEYPVFTIRENVFWVRSQGSSAAFLLDKTTFTDAISSSLSPTLGHKTLATNDYFEYSSVVVQGDIAWISLGSKVSKYDDVASTVTEFDIFGEEIVGMTYMGSFLKVYMESGKMGLWDGTTVGLTEVIDLGLPLERVKQIANQEFIITGDVGQGMGLYLMNGYTLSPLFRKKYSDKVGKWKFDFSIANNNTCIENDKDILYMIDTDGSDDRLAKFGKDIQGLPNAYSYILTKDESNNTLGDIDSILFWRGNLYISHSGTQKGVLKVDETSRLLEGSITTNINDMGMGILRKSKTHLYLRVEDISSTQYIEVYESTDSGSYSLIHTVNSQPHDNIARIPIIGDFRELSYKFVFKTSTSTSPKIYYGPMIDYELHQN